MNTRTTGNQAENRALLYLESNGLQLVTRNFSWRRGEIDLIMLDQNCLVFVEVRMRNNPNYGTGADTVDFRKMRKIIATAQHYLRSQTIPSHLDCRFDVISVDDSVDWIQNAFTLDTI